MKQWRWAMGLGPVLALAAVWLMPTEAPAGPGCSACASCVARRPAVVAPESGSVEATTKAAIGLDKAE